jgi:DNA-binding response OmpR family regulator
LDEAYLSKFGLTNQKGEFMSKLISNYWDSNQENIITNLSDKQKELFELFIKNEEQIVQKSEIEDIISSSKNYSLWGFYKYLSRFREEIKPDYELLNVYGKGYYIRRRK